MLWVDGTNKSEMKTHIGEEKLSFLNIHAANLSEKPSEGNHWHKSKLTDWAQYQEMESNLVRKLQNQTFFLWIFKGVRMADNVPANNIILPVRKTSWLIDWVLFYIPLESISVIRRRHHCRQRPAKCSLCSRRQSN